MTAELQTLARRAVACEGWRWMPGMLARPIGGGFPLRYNNPQRGHDLPDDSGVRYIPDLTDPATRGCLLALVREAWDRPMLVAYYAPLSMGQGWYVADRFCGDRDYPVVEAPSGSEAEALVAALEAAP